MNKPTLLIMAGGTGGHVFPGLALAKHMQSLNWDIQWLGTPEKMEADLVPKYGFPIHFVNIGGVRGKSIITKLLTPIKLLLAVFQAIKILKICKPNVVLGMGGFASGPGGLAAKVMGIPLLVHEQNAIFGLTNRYLSKMAKVSMTGFDLSKNREKSKAPNNAVFVGNPIREAFFQIPKQSIASLNTNKNGVNILIVGGSLGALALNQEVPRVLKEVAKQHSIEVRHQAGKGKTHAVIEAYAQMPNAKVEEFIDDMESAFAWADIIICRAGALTVAEVAGAGRVAIFVPLPIAVDDHQRENAKYLSEQDAAILIDQSLLEQQLLTNILELCDCPEKRIKMANKAKQLAMAHATDSVANIIQNTASNVDTSNENKNKEERT